MTARVASIHCRIASIPFASLLLPFLTQVGFAGIKETDDDRANIGRTIIGAPIVGQ